MTTLISVKVEVSEDGLFPGDWDGVNLDASAEKYAELVEAAITEAYPDAEIRIEATEQATLNSLVVDCEPIERDLIYSNVEQMISDIYNDYEAWVVNE